MSDIIEIINAAGPVAEVRLNRPEKKNAFSMKMFDALPNAAQRLGEQAGLRAVVLCGAGGCFSAGLDIAVFPELAGRLDQVKMQLRNPDAGETANFFQHPVTCWQALPVPVIAAVEGVCLGAGMQLALAADFRFAAPDAQFSIMETKWGLIPDMGITQSLPKLVAADVAKQLIMTADVISAQKALELGLITRITDDPVKEAHAFALQLAERSPDAVNAAKKLVDQAWRTDPAGLALEGELQAQIIGGANQIEAVMANMQKRPPKFT